MTATNYTIFKATDVEGFKFGSTAWSSADFISTGNALDTTFTSNNSSILLDLVGDRDAATPVKSEAFAKEIQVSGNERSTEDLDLLGKDVSGSQNGEVIGGAVSKIRVEATIVYRNNVPLSIFNDTTKCCLIEMDNAESGATGKANFAFNNITMVHVGSLSRNTDGAMEQKVIFECKGGITGTPIAVTQTSPSESWSKVVGGDYAEEIRIA
jgi:hypothetical protein